MSLFKSSCTNPKRSDAEDVDPAGANSPTNEAVVGIITTGPPCLEVTESSEVSETTSGNPLTICLERAAGAASAPLAEPGLGLAPDAESGLGLALPAPLSLLKNLVTRFMFASLFLILKRTSVRGKLRDQKRAN